MQPLFSRRLAAMVVVACAALAIVATSPVRWHRTAAVRGVLEMAPNVSTVRKHIAVRMVPPSAVANITPQFTLRIAPVAGARVRIEGPSGASGPDADGAVTHWHSAQTPCVAHAPCGVVFTVEWTRASSTEVLRAPWSAEADVRCIGDDRPAVRAVAVEQP
jgi:hypothetical protein